jgi:hypothetical protein
VKRYTDNLPSRENIVRCIFCLRPEAPQKLKGVTVETLVDPVGITISSRYLTRVCLRQLLRLHRLLNLPGQHFLDGDGLKGVADSFRFQKCIKRCEALVERGAFVVVIVEPPGPPRREGWQKPEQPGADQDANGLLRLARANDQNRRHLKCGTRHGVR